MGIEKEARPAERLMRKFGEFERRKEARPIDAEEPSSPALPTVRPALAAKVDPFASSSPAAAQQTSKSTASKKPKSSKMQIFADDSGPVRPDSGSSSKGWDSIGSIAERKKENSHAAKPWAGEKLKGGKTNGGVQKMAIFKDAVSPHSILRRLLRAICLQNSGLNNARVRSHQRNHSYHHYQSTCHSLLRAVVMTNSPYAIPRPVDLSVCL